MPVERQSAEAVVRIVSIGFQSHNRLSDFGHIIAIGIPNAKDLVAGDNIDPVVGPASHTHRKLHAVEERSESVGPAVAIGIFNDSQPVVFGPGVIFRSEVGVRLDYEQSATGIKRCADRGDDVGLAGKKFETIPRVQYCRSLGCRWRWQEE